MPITPWEQRIEALPADDAHRLLELLRRQFPDEADEAIEGITGKHEIGATAQAWRLEALSAEDVRPALVLLHGLIPPDEFDHAIEAISGEHHA